MLSFEKLFGKFLRKHTQKQTEQVFVDSQTCHQLIRDHYTIDLNTGSPATYRECEPLSDPEKAILKLIAVAFSETIPNVKVKKQTFMHLGVVRYVEWNSGEYMFQIKASIRTTDK